MLLFLFILSIVNTVLSIVTYSMVKKDGKNKLYSFLSVIQGASGGAMMGILLVLVLLGRTLG
ncbi:hypothetical protein NRIC_35300 [Enterococcus florum]|uniref:Uncharacterized protein n=1 Tax=Enterococcus florum TaxID=2480627 RepID=A0A4V0WQ01_9ENTE|nr:hypothetical protein [Enterococcus florum]GCF95639.1 hypothetical protein NRIC_35300 [Enterococcus florum]